MCNSHLYAHTHPHTHEPAPLLTRRNLLRLSALGLATAALSACARGRAAVQTVPTVENLQPADLAGFAAFRQKVTVLRDERYFLIESDGMAAHEMMAGIRSWQQQVPLPQPYHGANAWRIPTVPKLAAAPISARTALFRGAIAIAVDGVPIFNALNNRGDDTLLVGELDDFGGHAGRADDYHYHTAPLHLQAQAGTGNPIAYALDGFPLYGLLEPDGSLVFGLDEFNGHADAAGRYHYHATRTYPYINGGLRGEVTVSDDQVEPQPHTTPVRPWLQPLRGATVTGFTRVGESSFILEYALDGRTHQVRYRFAGAHYTFEFVGPDGAVRTETYERPRGE
ncbi:MAG: YHYH protein [Chloroflexi bacterium]|nr:YHYH protein [Chloroflexota bacterium]